jgi:hypothetical protein
MMDAVNQTVSYWMLLKTATVQVNISGVFPEKRQNAREYKRRGNILLTFFLAATFFAERCHYDVCKEGTPHLWNPSDNSHCNVPSIKIISIS